MRSDWIKRSASAAAGAAAASGALTWLERAANRAPHRLRALMYHRVAESGADPALDPGLISATPAGFAAQMRHVASRYTAVSIETLLEAQRGGRPLPPRAVLITFDDAYADFETHAWPVLRELGLPAVLFVPTAYPDARDRDFWWDRLHRAIAQTSRGTPLPSPLGPLPLADEPARRQTSRALREHVKRLPHDAAMALVDQLCDSLGGVLPEPRVLGWDRLRALAADGLSLAPHSRSHALLNRVSQERAYAEALGSRRDLEREIGAAPPVFAYPSGAYDARAVDALREAGFELAFTTQRGVEDLRHADPLRLRRLPIGLRITQPVFRSQLLGWTARLNPLWPTAAAA